MDRILLGTIHHTIDADHRCGDRQGCLGGTRGDILQQLDNWLEDTQGQCVFWLNGLAGTGKSTIAQTFAEITFAEGKLGAGFFCSRSFEDRSNLRAIFPTLAFQLAYQYPLFRKELLKVLRANPGIGHQSLCSQLEKLIVGPFKATQISTLIIIDALDECRDEEPASAILSMLSRYVGQIPNIKFFITGRPEPRIRSGFRLESLVPITEVLKLHEVKPEMVNSDIGLFFRIRLTSLAKTRSDCNLTEDWPSPSDIEILCKKAAGFFIYASTVVKFVTSKIHTPAEQLNRITSLPQSTYHEGRSGIDLLYTQVLEQAVDDVDVDNKELCSRFKTVVGTLLLLFNPLSMKALSDLLRVPNASTALRPLHSLLLIPDNGEDPIHIFHKSFPDFLTDPKRCGGQWFFVDPPVHHTEILLSCLSFMRGRLKKNICNLADHAFLGDVKDLPTCQKTCIGNALEYACRFWTRHLVAIPSSSQNIEGVYKAIDGFFTTCLLFWIEVLSLTGNLNAGIHALNDVQEWYLLVSCAENPLEPVLTLIQAGISYKQAYDSQRVLLENFDALQNSPSEIYHSALLFSPSSSWLRKCYSTELPQGLKVIKGIPVGWGSCSRTVVLNGIPLAFAYWKDTVAVGLQHSNIIILNTLTGSQVAVLFGHTKCVRSVTFSSDGTSLVSGSDDMTLKLWDVQTGGVVKTFHGHTKYIYSVSISYNHTTIASGSHDETIRLWDLQTGECHHIINQEQDVEYVSFSPTNSQHLISISGGVVYQWGIDGHQIEPTYQGSCAAFSSDGTHLALCEGEVTTVQNSNSGAIVAKFPTEKDPMYCCFSPNGRLVAIAVGVTAYVWDIIGSDPHLVETFVGHTEDITFLTFSSSSSLISASDDELTVKFWQIGALSTDPVANNPESTTSTSASIVSVTLQAENGIAISSDGDGVVKTWDISTGLCKGLFQTPTEGPCWRDARMIDGRLIVVWHEDGEIHSWNTEQGELLQVVEISQESLGGLRISGDGSKVFLLAGRFIRAWSLMTGETVGAVELEDESYLDLLSMGSSRIYLRFPNSLTLGWDFGTSGSSPVPLPNTSLEKPCLDLIGGANLTYQAPFSIKNTVSGKEIFQLSGRYASPEEVQWDGRYLVAGYESGDILILDFEEMLPQ